LKAPRTSSILQDVFQCTAWLVNGRGLLVADDDRIGGERGMLSLNCVTAHKRIIILISFQRLLGVALRKASRRTV
jgi:hypothetical protein